MGSPVQPNYGQHRGIKFPPSPELHATQRLDVPKPNLAISPLEIARLQQLRFGGRVLLISTVEDEERAEAFFEGVTLVGFDTETKPNTLLSPKNRTAIMQVATEKVAVVWKISELNCM